MTQREIIYTTNNGKLIHVLQSKVSQNSKIGIGYILQTYHFSIDQLQGEEASTKHSFRNDKLTCLDCPLSYSNNNGNSGGCYTHKGMQFNGLISMIKRLKRIQAKQGFKAYDLQDIKTFVQLVKNTYPLDLIRFGAYGEPIHLGEEVVNELTTLTANFTGYTHQYKKSTYNWSKNYFMASVHNSNDLKIANIKKFRSFIAKSKDFKIEGVNCPASKEASTNLTCIACKLCNGKSKGIKKNVFINIH